MNWTFVSLSLLAERVGVLQVLQRRCQLNSATHSGGSEYFPLFLFLCAFRVNGFRVSLMYKDF